MPGFFELLSAKIFWLSTGLLLLRSVPVPESKIASAKDDMLHPVTCSVVDHTMLVYEKGSPRSNTHGWVLSACPNSVAPLSWSEMMTSTCAKDEPALSAAASSAASFAASSLAAAFSLAAFSAASFSAAAFSLASYSAAAFSAAAFSAAFSAAAFSAAAFSAASFSAAAFSAASFSAAASASA